MTEATQEKVYIIVLNWNSWRETIACLESIFKLDYDNFTIVLCDNHSENESIDKITSWLDGHDTKLVDLAQDARSALLLPAKTKPIDYTLVNEHELQSIGYTDSTLVIVRNSKNYGYAGGNNVGLNYAVSDPACKAIWVVNNDVVVTPGSLTALLRELSSTNSIVGSKVLDYSDGSLQSPGGSKYNRFTGKSRIVPADGHGRIAQLDYISGCSIFFPRRLVSLVGLFCTDYFLYYEELDYAIRAKKFGFELRYAEDSIVYHKRGASIGISALADFYIIRSRLKFTKKFFPKQYNFVQFSVFLTACMRTVRGQWKRAYMIITILANPNQEFCASKWGDQE